MTNGKAAKKRTDPNVYPPGYNNQRIKAIADHYDAQKDEDVLGEIETAKSVAHMVWIEIPQELVPKVRKLMAAKKRIS